MVGIKGKGVLKPQDSVIQQVEFYPQSSRCDLRREHCFPPRSQPPPRRFRILSGLPAGSLGFGLALLGPYPADPSACELLYYSGNVSNSLSGVTRGMGGTFATAWPAGTPIAECNLYITGLRYPTHYTRGQANNQLGLPPAWIDALKDSWHRDSRGLNRTLKANRLC